MVDQDIASAFQGAAIPLRLDRHISVPSLNIFLGSTPGYAALEVMRRVVLLPELDRRHVAFVHLDIDSPPAEVLAFRESHKGKLTESDLRISVAYGALYADPLPSDRVQHTYIPGKTPQSWDAGAGGIRNNGHVAACTFHTEIRQVIEEALASLKALPQDPGVAPIRDILINIVAFLGGGTGSGILPDITVMVREQVNKLNLPHRLNVFCLLPEQFGEATTNDVSWRKSNATATLLEMLALCLAKDGLRNNSNGAWPGMNHGMNHGDRYAPHPGANSAGGPVYTKYMLNAPYTIEGTTIAHEIYLFGNTSVKNAVDAARIIGIDLYSRIANSSGVGYLERSKSVDRRTLDSGDQNKVPTMFGATCPLEVLFPGHATAHAFALITAAKVLPQLGGQLDPAAATPGLSLSEQADVATWKDALKTVQRRFEDNDFARAGRGRLDRYKGQLKKQIEDARADITSQAQTLEKQEQAKIRQTQLRQLSDRIAVLESLQRVYAEYLRVMNTAGRPAPASDGDIEDAVRKLSWALPVFSMQERAVAQLTNAFNRTQNRAIERIRWDKRKEILDHLLAETREELERIRVAHREMVGDDIIRALREQGEASAAWNGRLDEPHVHSKHLFDLPRLRKLKPVERLYEVMMRRVRLDRQGDEFMTWMRLRYSDELDIVGVGAVDLRFRLVEYLRDAVFLPELRTMNLLDLLQECCIETARRATTNDALEDLLYEHLENMRKLARPLVTVETQLWADGQETTSTTVFLGMNYRDGAQRRIINCASDRLGQFDSQGPKPFLAVSADPHLMQLVYGRHAFSLGTVPDFYYESNSSMDAFLQRQAAWYGDGRTTYGLNKAPVFSSGEMERLVMDPSALGDRRDLPHRIIRPPQTFAGDYPTTWGPGTPYAGQPPFTNQPPPTPHPNNQPPYPGQDGDYQQWRGNGPPGGLSS